MNIGGLEIGSCVRHADGFACGGDACVVRMCAGAVVLAIVDALGHGPEASRVAVRAEAVLEEAQSPDPVQMLGSLEADLAATIGAAVGVAIFHPADGAGTFVGVGNTVARLFGATERRLVPVDGIVGQRRATARPSGFVLGVGETLVMHSDGISSRFALSDYAGLRSDDPETASRELARRFGKNYDDVACIVARRTA